MAPLTSIMSPFAKLRSPALRAFHGNDAWHVASTVSEADEKAFPFESPPFCVGDESAAAVADDESGGGR